MRYNAQGNYPVQPFPFVFLLLYLKATLR